MPAVLAVYNWRGDSARHARMVRFVDYIFERLPKNDAEAQLLLERGQEIARRMSWEVVADDYLLPGLRNGIR